MLIINRAIEFDIRANACLCGYPYGLTLFCFDYRASAVLHRALLC